jgi:hypothetical protein
MKPSNAQGRTPPESGPEGRLVEFQSESALTPQTNGGTRLSRFRAPRKLLIGTVLSIAAIVAVIGVWSRSTVSGAEARSGILSVESDPQDAIVSVDGTPRGTTPMSIVLRPGKHQLLLRRGDLTREFSIDIAPSVSMVHHITWPSDGLPSSQVGSLRVVSEAAGVAVIVDDVKRGSTPVTIRNLSAGDHVVILRGNGSVLHRTIRVEPGTTASLVISGSAPDARLASGWLSASTAAPLQILEDGKLVGSTESERIMLPAGAHEFEFVNRSLGFSVARHIDISPGQTTTIAIDLPRAPISVNALPWAQVWLDGDALGATPIGNITTTVGTHELIFRHPQLGERRVTALVTLKDAARIAVDMRKTQ